MVSKEVEKADLNHTSAASYPSVTTETPARKSEKLNASANNFSDEIINAINKCSTEFDEDFYLSQLLHTDIKNQSPFEHYMNIGWTFGVDPAPWFSTKAYLQKYPDVSESGMNPFLHYFQYGQDEGRELPEYQATTMPSGMLDHSTFHELTDHLGLSADDLSVVDAFIDNDYYISHLPHVDFSHMSPAAHYLTVGWIAGIDPSRHFSTSGYLQRNPDVASSGINPLLHFLRTGRAEGRRWGDGINGSKPADGRLEWKDYEYVCHLADASLEVTKARVDALDFCIALQGADFTKIIGRLSFLRPDFTGPVEPLVSIIIPCLNQQVYTAECLASIDRSLPSNFDIEVIIADNASSDPLYEVISNNSEIRIIRFGENIGFGPACNRAAEIARGKYLFFLNNDAQISPGCLEVLVNVMEDIENGTKIGAVGPKILSFDGTLQEAGCLLNRDGTGTLIGFGRDHETPRYNYRRAVEHVSGAAVLIRKQIFEEVGGFDPIYAPAYCEDADLSMKLRKRGLHIVYEPSSIVAHHLSKTTNSSSSQNAKHRLIARNRRYFLERWSQNLYTTDIRTIAFYLPQYHPIPENNTWWGKGFTEWTNIGKATPNFEGQYQPRLPGELGYYDLRVPEVMEQQAALAREYGVSGFCYYYYWFNGRRLLDHPLERMLITGKPDLPFCLCWANENWTRRWDGRDDQVLMAQDYEPQHAEAIAEDFVRFFRSSNYIRVNGRPLILIYRIKELPNPKRFIAIWRNVCRRAGIGEICVAMVESFELSASPQDPIRYGCDLTVEFPAHGMVHDAPRQVVKLNSAWTGSVHDYRELAGAFMRRIEPGFKRLRSVLVGWDNTPRHRDKSLILENATPGGFQAWLEWTYRRTIEQNIGDERIVFINAWNEWCEGSYLEPDQRFGRAYLQAVRNALDNVESGGHSFVEVHD
ncbi:glycosyltransferase [Azospirillum sp. B21]|uniref:glycoside hydrolase family 99-like domain-containing protein n=1 Tax=Azospirillum sp. B21 TaxID=2607496 RepID=UPI0011EFD5D3|nr:glycoside hydrolase family 99-like domain-containing protein [Azospirillum sp. B21]KAA0577944.1 glycosyltransferase [Azospirillum sp. B21]